MKRLARLIVGTLLAFSFCTSATASQRNDVLVIVNDNSHDSPLIGDYYAQQRGVVSANVIHVNIPNQYYIDWIQFTNLRDQILRQGICLTIAPAARPIACSDTNQAIYTQGNIDALTALTPIKYIVTTRGVPPKVNTSLISGDSQTTSVDNYLRLWLAKYYQQDTTTPPTQRGVLFDDGRGMRVVNPAIDKEYIIGRIDGVNLTSATALVDRAIRTEADGLYGNLFASTFGNTANGGSFQWTNYRINQSIYQTSDGTNDFWRYAFGPFGENRPECSDYKNNFLSVSNQTSPTAKTPTQCRVQFNKGEPNEAAPGVSYSRQPLAINAMGYFGSLDGQSVEGGFSTLLNWRKQNGTCTALCDNATDPAACRANSTDPYQEINTECVGVADGFIGYNFQSFPLSVFGVWPTDWYSVNIDFNDTPVIRNNDGQDDSYSVWFSNVDDVSGTSQQRLGIQQSEYFSAPPTTSQTYRLSFSAKGEYSASSVQFSNGLQAYYAPDGSVTSPTCPGDSHYQLSGTSCIYTDRVNNYAASSWTPISRDISVPAIAGWKNTSLTVQLGSGEQLPAGGGLGFDNISLKNVNDATNTQLVTNGSFNQGHKQTSQGDYAANFLSRLGGTAFWGSLSHHGSGGHSFDRSSLGTLVYFLKGLPLGDAVWLGDGNNDGDLYGDPLYSPVSVKLNYLQDATGSFIGSLALSGDTINGRDITKVGTTYSVDFCPGADFYLCDQQSLWQSTGISGGGSQTNQSLGTWAAGSLANGAYLLRLKVTSTNLSSGKVQSFFDYLPVKKRYAVISGTVRDNVGQALVGVKVAINDNYGFASSVTTDQNGYYAGSVPKNGMYLVYPSKSGHTIQAVSGTAFQTINGQDVKNKDFLATANNYLISGVLKDQNGQPLPNVPVAINDNYGFTSTSNTNSNGYFAQGGLKNGVYLVYPMLAGYTFAPVSGSIFQSISNANVPNKDFVGTKPGYSISGTVKTSTGLPLVGAIVYIAKSTNTYSANALTDVNGYYVWRGLDNGSYLVSPSYGGCSISVAFVSINSADIPNKNFTGTCAP